MREFDDFIAIDWSGARAVQTPSIAVAAVAAGSPDLRLLYPSGGRLWSRTEIFDSIIDLAQKEKRTLIGIDANLGYAAEIARKHLKKDGSAFDLWSYIDSVCSSNDNLYAACFWNHPDIRDDFWLKGKKSESIVLLKRETEQACAQQGLGNPESTFKLLGPKQVGKGGLAAMRLCHHLKKCLSADVAFWPFSTVHEIERAKIVICEIYPRLFIKRSGFPDKKIHSHEHLKTVLGFFEGVVNENIPINDHITDALVAACGMKYFLKNGGFDLSDRSGSECQPGLEGWIMGVH